MKIKMLVMDIDGTLTDGRIYIGPDGEMMKAFDVKDGYGIVHLKEYEIMPVVITGRSSYIVERRMKELQINEYHQGVKDMALVIGPEGGLEPEEAMGLGETFTMGPRILRTETAGMAALAMIMFALGETNRKGREM